MKKSVIDLNAPADEQVRAIKENVEIVTGQRAGKIVKTKGLSTPSVGVDVAAGAGTQVTTKAEHDALITAFRDLESKFNALADRLNTP